MDLDSLKEPLGDEQFNSLSAYIADLVGQRDAARKESIDGRKGLRAKVDELERTRADLFERLGIGSVEELAEIDPKGQAEAAKQFEARTKRLERELAESKQTLAAITERHQGSLRDAALAKALAAHEFIDTDLVASYVAPRLVLEEDAVLFRTAAGSLAPLSDGLATLAKEKPHLLKAHGAGGSGYRKPVNGDGGQRNPWAKDSFNLTEQLRLTSENPDLAQTLKAQAAH